VTSSRGASFGHRIRSIAPGLGLCLLIAAAGTALGAVVPLVGGPVGAIILGALVGTLVRVDGRLRPTLGPGVGFASRPVLQASIVVLGTGLSLRQIGTVGAESLPVMLGTLAVALGGAYLIGRAIGVRGDAQTLIGVGTAICGASAIAATAAVIRPREHTVAYAVGTIFAFNIAAVLVFPPIGHLLGMAPHPFGLWAGTAVNDTSSVVAAAYAFSPQAGPYAIVVKLTRTLMLIPIVIVLAAWSARRAGAGPTATDADGSRRRVPGRLPWRRLVPLFLIGFLAAATLRSVGAIPNGWVLPLQHVGTFLISTALAGIGLSISPAAIRAAGIRPLILGGALWIVVATSSLGLQAITGTL
jgi:uncharacterized integral membrane protein (TIGR00698 family)